MKKALIVIAAGLLLGGVAACSSPPTSGTVYQKPYAGPGWWYSTDCGMYGSVTRTRSTAYTSGGRTYYRSETYTDHPCVMWVQHAHPTPPSWELCLRDDADSKHTGCFDVPEATWNRYEVGGHYPDPR